MSIQKQKITEAAIAANGVQSRPDKLTGTAAQLGAAVVTTEKLAALSVLATHIAQYAVTAQKIAPGAVTAEKIAALAVTTALLAPNAVTAEKLANDIPYTKFGLAADQVRHVYAGTTEPGAELGSDGDIYLKYAE